MAGGCNVYIKYIISHISLGRQSFVSACQAEELAATVAVPEPLVPSHPCSCTSVDVSSQTRAAASGVPGRFFLLPASGNQTSLLFQPCLPLHTPQIRGDPVSSRPFGFHSFVSGNRGVAYDKYLDSSKSLILHLIKLPASYIKTHSSPRKGEGMPSHEIRLISLPRK
jgi:hypothetical protein